MEQEVEAFLEHFGVKGMRWGVITKAKKVESNRRISLEAKYIKSGSSEAQAKKRAEGRLKTEKILLAVGAITVASLGAYQAKQAIGKRFAKVVLEPGTELKYINALGDRADLDRRLYTTYKEGDTKKYRGMLAKQLQRNTPLHNPPIYETVLTAKEKIKAPSHRQAEKVFKELRRSGHISARESYKKFNQGLVQDTADGRKFYEALSRRGFNAVLDSNDQFMSGYNTKKPIILFNAASTTVKTGQKVVEQNTINKLYNRQLAGVLAKQFAPAAGIGAAVTTLNMGLESNTKYDAVNKYFIDNPGATESPSVIFARLRQTPTGRYVVGKNIRRSFK